MSGDERHEFCGDHKYLRETLEKIDKRQELRLQDEIKMGVHARLGRLEEEDRSQWQEISALKKLVYMGAGAAGVLAFLGSILGELLKKL